MQIYLYQNGQRIGPYNETQIRGMLSSRQICEDDLGWHEGITQWQPLNTILAFAAPLPIFTPVATQSLNSPVACPTCGAPKWHASDPCQVCTTAHIASMNLIHQQPTAEKPRKIIDKRGAWCTHCGNRNSYRKSDGAGCLTLGILFISLIGVLFIPFLPKTWHCNECGHTWK